MRSKPTYQLEDGEYKECNTCLEMLKIDTFPYHDSPNSPWRNLCHICVIPMVESMKTRAKLNKINELELSKVLLSRLGYQSNTEVPIHQQFNIKHGFTE